MRALGIAVFLGLGLGGCREGSPAPASASSGPAVAPLSSASAAPSALPSAPPPAPSAQASPAADAAPPAPSGGNWLKCYAQFQPRTRPELDVMKLGLMCGPSNGMRKAAASEGVLAEAGKEREHRFKAESGDCYRIFTVAEPAVEDLDVEVLGPSGAKVAFDTSDDRWPIVKPDGPFCVFTEGEYRAVVRAQRGQGKYAIEIWRLR